MNVTYIAARGRAMAERLMTDHARIVRRDPPVTHADGSVTTEETVIYDGKCKVQTAGGIGAESTALGGLTQVWSLYLHLPFCKEAALVRPDDVAVITGSEGVDGHMLRMLSPQSEKTHATAIRWNVKEVD